jgi:hypothetical protein
MRADKLVYIAYGKVRIFKSDQYRQIQYKEYSVHSAGFLLLDENTAYIGKSRGHGEYDKILYAESTIKNIASQEDNSISVLPGNYVIYTENYYKKDQEL